MEKSTITFEIKQEVSIFLMWSVGGIILVSIAFFLPAPSNELWPQLYSCCIAAMVYLLALLFYIVRKPVSMVARASATACSIFVAGCLLFACLQMDSNAHWQVKKILEIRATTGRGTIRYYTTTPLIKTFQAYYQQGASKKENLAQLFLRLNNNAVVGSNIHKPYYDRDSLQIFLQVLEPDRIVLVSQEVYVKGKNPVFRNFNGREGMIQEKCILTSKGITYVSEN